jgi:hypothetical protein
MSLRLTCTTMLALFLLLAVPTYTPARLAASVDEVVPKFSLQNGTFQYGLFEISRAVPIGFGFEKVLKDKLSDPESPEPRFTIELRNKSVREILNALCTLDPRYTWRADKAEMADIVNVFPINIGADPSYLLNRRLDKFEVHNVTDTLPVVFAIPQQLPPPFERIAEAQAGGSDPFPPEPWDLTLTNVTVREVINALALHGGAHAIWIFGGAKDFRAFGFFNTRPQPWLEKPLPKANSRKQN